MTDDSAAEFSPREFSLVDRVVVVTGAGRGLGRSIAIGMASAGARVVAVARTAAQLEQVVSSIQGNGGQAMALPIDVTAPEAADAAIDAAQQNYGRVDALVYGAGVAGTRPSLEVTAQDWDRVMDTNLRAAFFWAQASARAMCKADGGSMVFLSSVLARTGSAWLAPYGASKGGLDSMIRALAVEWGNCGIRVNGIAAGFVKTELTAAEFSDERLVARTVKRLPLGRLGQAPEIAGAAVFLASDAARYVTGHVLAVDGGWTAS